MDGSNFVAGASVLWSGAARSTTFVSATRLTASIPASDIGAVGSALVGVRNPDGQASDGQLFSIAPPGGLACPPTVWFTEYFSNVSLSGTPTRTACEPHGDPASRELFQLYGVGAPDGLPADNFSVRWTGRFPFAATAYTFRALANDAARIYVDGVLILTTANQGQTYWVTRNVTAGEHEVKIEFWDASGTANVAVDWRAIPAADALLFGISPTNSIDGKAFTLTADGLNYTPGSTVFWNGEAKPTTFVSSTRLTAAIPAEDVTHPTSVGITVRTPGLSITNVQIFTVGPAPAITALTPSSAAAGGPDFTLTIDGTGFVSGAVVIFNGVDRATTFVSATRLTVPIPAASIRFPGIGSVQVRNPGGIFSNTVGFPITTRPDPILTALTPSSTTAGGPAFTLIADGDGFQSGVQLLWNGSARSTTQFSSMQVRASITAADIATAGAVTITIRSLDGKVSNAMTFTVTGAGSAPTLTSITPSGAMAGGLAFTLTADGSGFVSGATVLWNGAARTTTFVNAGRLTASIPAADIAVAGSASVTVRNPDNQVSGAKPFTINGDAPCSPGQFSAQYFSNMTLTAPATLTQCEAAVNYDWGAGGPAGLPVDNFSARWTRNVSFPAGSVTFTVRADDGVRLFLDGVAIIDQWHDQPATTYTATRTVTAGTHEVKVEYYENTGDAVIQLSWTTGPPPTITTLTPNTAAAGGPAFTLTVDGTSFVSGATVMWNGSGRQTTFVSPTRLMAAIAALDISSGGTIPVTVRNPDLQVSNVQTFTVTGTVCSPGLFRAEYFSNISLTPPATRTACEETVFNDYGAGGPTGLPVDNFSVRWTGRFSLSKGNYQFTARADDGVRVFLDGVPIID
ncbi:MAG: hypothetical protein DMD78_09295, partial [Candidatus Rokuibacteriota bacterium]